MKLIMTLHPCIRLYTLILLALFFSPAAWASTEENGQSASTAVDSLPETARDNSLLWEIRSDALDTPSYIFGTIHLISEDDFIIRELVEKSLQQCEQIAFELKLNDLSMMSRMMSAMKLEDSMTLEELMSPEDFQLLSNYLRDSLNADIADYNRMKPLFLYQEFLQTMIEGNLKSFELHFLGLAVKNDLEIFGLETLEDQLAVFDSIPLEEQIQWIMEGIREHEDYSMEWDDLIEAYRKEDLIRLYTIMTEQSPELMAYEDLFLNNRNNNWIPVIEELIANKPTFIAVGAGHLPGDEGLLNLLREKGYRLIAR